MFAAVTARRVPWYAVTWGAVVLTPLAVAGLVGSLVAAEPSTMFAVALTAAVVGMMSALPVAADEDAEAEAGGGVFRRSLRRGATAAVGTWLGVGLLALIGGPAVVCLALLAITAPRSVSWLSRRTSIGGVGVLCDRDLCRAWHDSSRALVGVPVGRRLDLVRRRHALLDEMERRHAAGVESWLASKACADGDLERYVLGRGAGRR